VSRLEIAVQILSGLLANPSDLRLDTNQAYLEQAFFWAQEVKDFEDEIEAQEEKK
jgi:hypothetical protein